MRISLHPCNTEVKQNIIGLEFNSLPLPGAEAKKEFVRYSIQTCLQTPPHRARCLQAELPSDERLSDAWRQQWTSVHLDMKFKFGAAGSYLSYKGWNVRDSFVTQETCCVVCACESESVCACACWWTRESLLGLGLHLFLFLKLKYTCSFRVLIFCICVSRRPKHWLNSTYFHISLYILVRTFRGVNKPTCVLIHGEQKN